MRGGDNMSNIIGPSFIALQVPDLAKAKEFYTNILGLEVDPAGPPHAVVFKTLPIQIALREPTINLNDANHLGWGSVIWLSVTNIDELRAKLVENSIKIISDIQPGPFGRYMVVTDLNGYVLTFHQLK